MNHSHEEVTNWALDLLDLGADDHVLDVGCGGGATMARILSRMRASGRSTGRDVTGTVFGVDYSRVSCEESRAFNAEAIAEGRMDVVEASVESLPFPDGAFDVVTTVESFYFWPSPLANLREVARVVRPGGRFLLVADVYMTEGLPGEVLANIREHDMTVLTPEQYEGLFARAGFSSCEVHLLPGTTWIAVEGIR